MKILIFNLKVFLFLLFFSSLSFSKDKIVYVDMNFLINSSKAGNSINKQMENLVSKNNLEYEKLEKKLLEEEKNIIKKKNVLDAQRYEAEVLAFRNKINNFKSERRNKVETISKKNVDAKNELVKIITKILAEYSAKNEISLVLNKESIILGKKTIDISDNILELLNDEIKNIKLK